MPSAAPPSGVAAPSLAAPTLASQLNDAISRLDMRLASLTQAAPRATQAATEPAYGQPPMPRGQAAPRQTFHDQAFQAPGQQNPAYQTPGYHNAPPLNPAGLDAAVAEISARQSSLSGGNAYPAQPFAPQTPASQASSVPVDLSGIERQLNQLTSQMEALRRPDQLDQSIAAFREELADIRRSLTEALPRQAIEALENEIRALGQKIERNRDSVGDQEALGGIEKALNDIYGVVRTLTPAEQLAGYDAAIQGLSNKIDVLIRSNPDSNIVQLQDAIAALRNIAANVASNESIGHLSDHIRSLGEKVDHLAETGGHDMLAALEQRIALLTAAMEGRPTAPASDFSHLEGAIRTLTERIDRIASLDSASAMAAVEQRIAYLLERLESTQSAGGHLGRIEEGLADILRQLEGQRANIASLGADAPADARGLMDTLKRELSDVRHTQSATERRTQDALEAVHSTLTHVADRLTAIEGDLRRAQPGGALPQSSAQPAFMAAGVSQPPGRPELPNPVPPPMAELPMAQAPSIATGFAPAPPVSPFRAEEPTPAWPPAGQRAPIDPSLPPDFPLEPGARGRGAASLEPEFTEPAAPAEDTSPSNFIAAARRAAQAAQAATVEKPSRVAALTEAARNAAAKATEKVKGSGNAAKEAKPSRIRQILVGFGVVMIVIGAFRVALTLLDGADDGSQQTIEKSAVPPSVAPVPAPALPPKAEIAPPASPLLTSPTAVERQTFVAPVTGAQTQTAAREPLPAQPAGDVTGSVSAPAASATTAPAAEPTSPATALPDAIGGPALRAAALKGDGAAAYEIAVRYSEGRGVPANAEEALRWYERAADKGVVMAMFRLGTMMEKGLGTKKDPETARRYYVQAAERGNAKAMHNLAVLDADGGGKGPNYKNASVWFRKAADHGVADSQYNLAILYARGIGVEQNLAESFKWFSLAAAQGDADAGQKRDDIAKRLDPQSLAAAKLAVQTFTPERQPADAINVAAPAGGWDAPSANKPQPGSAKSAQHRPAKSVHNGTASRLQTAAR
ncbi:hypothetical protein [Afipia sp. P52-10]|jgi:localization factor PodJL|uniref:hypothetical protein n=1 Tax=Afipia sp. P52-10 TaxID=1429916 RepID=UPI0004B1F151|nr:hypothetical protein [Afipia sp. P52-10]